MITDSFDDKAYSARSRTSFIRWMLSGVWLIPSLLDTMKGGIARKLFLHHPEMKKKLWGGHPLESFLLRRNGE